MATRRRRRGKTQPPLPAQPAGTSAGAAPPPRVGFNPFRQKRFVILMVLMVVMLPFEFMAINGLLEGPPGNSVDIAPTVVVGPDVMHDPYLTIPPTSGARSATAPEPGIYDREISNLDQVAALAEGYVIIGYSCPAAAGLCAAMVDELAAVVDSFPDSPVILAPYRAASRSHISVSAYGTVLALNQVDREVLGEFINAYAGAAVEAG